MAVSTRPKLSDLYHPSALVPGIVDVPPALFAMVDGAGDPNRAIEFQEAVQAVYSAAYGLKFLLKRKGIEYHVPPLEGLWWAPDATGFEAENKAAYRWTLMIAVPEEVDAQAFEEVRAQTRRRRPSQAVERMRLQCFEEGLAAQVMHIGPYATESTTIARLHAFIREHGYTFDSMGRHAHHEIYLGDPRRADPLKLKTIIRQAVGKAPQDA